MSSTDASPREESDDERAPLLDVEAAPKVTPLPRLQLFVAIFIQIAEPVTCSVIYPFVNDLIRDLGVTGGDEKKTGYYVGVVVSVPPSRSKGAFLNRSCRNPYFTPRKH